MLDTAILTTQMLSEGEEDLDKIDQCVEEVACDEVLGIVLKAWGGSPCTDDYESLEKTMEYWLTFIHGKWR